MSINIYKLGLGVGIACSMALSVACSPRENDWNEIKKKTSGGPSVEQLLFERKADPQNSGSVVIPKASDKNLIDASELPFGDHVLERIDIHIEMTDVAFEDRSGSTFVRDANTVEAASNKTNIITNDAQSVTIDAPISISKTAEVNFLPGDMKQFGDVFIEGSLHNPAVRDAVISFPESVIGQVLQSKNQKSKGVYSIVSQAKDREDTVFVTLNNDVFTLLLKTETEEKMDFVALIYKIDPTAQAQAASAGANAVLDDIKGVFASSGLLFDLETVEGGEGADSLFGSSAQGERTESQETLEQELALLIDLQEIILNSAEILSIMEQRNITQIKVINPYESTLKPKVESYFAQDGAVVKRVLLKLGMSEREIIEVLEGEEQEVSTASNLNEGGSVASDSVANVEPKIDVPMSSFSFVNHLASDNVISFAVIYENEALSLEQLDSLSATFYAVQSNPELIKALQKNNVKGFYVQDPIETKLKLGLLPIVMDTYIVVNIGMNASEMLALLSDEEDQGLENGEVQATEGSN